MSRAAPAGMAPRERPVRAGSAAGAVPAGSSGPGAFDSLHLLAPLLEGSWDRRAGLRRRGSASQLRHDECVERVPVEADLRRPSARVRSRRAPGRFPRGGGRRRQRRARARGGRTAGPGIGLRAQGDRSPSFALDLVVPFERLVDPVLGGDPRGHDQPGDARELAHRHRVAGIEHRNVQPRAVDLQGDQAEPLGEGGGDALDRLALREADRLEGGKGDPEDLREGLPEGLLVDEAEVDEMAAEVATEELLGPEGLPQLGRGDLALPDQKLADLLRQWTSRFRSAACRPPSPPTPSWQPSG